MTRSTWNPNSPEALGLEFLGVGTTGYSFPATHTQRGLRFRAQRTGQINKLTLHSGPGTSAPTLNSAIFAGHRFPYIAELVPLAALDTGGPHLITTLPSTITTDTNMDRSTGGPVGASDLAANDGVGISPTALPANATVAFQDASDFPLDRQVVSVAVEWSAFASNLRAVRLGDQPGPATPWSRVLAGGAGLNWHMGELWMEGGDTTAWHEVTPQMIRQFDTTVGTRRMQLQAVTFNPNFVYDMFRLHVDHFPERRIGTGVIEVPAGAVQNQRDVLIEVPFHAPGATGTPVSLVAGEEYVLVIRSPYSGPTDYASTSNLDLRAVTDQRDAAGTVFHFEGLDWDWHTITAYPAGTAQSGTNDLTTLLTGLPTALLSATGAPTVDSQPYLRTVGGRVSQATGEVLRQHNVPNPSPLTEYRSLRFNASLGLAGAVPPTDPLQVSLTLPGIDDPFLGPFSISPEQVQALGTTLNRDEFLHEYHPVTVDFGSGETLPTLFDVLFESVTPAELPWRVAVLQSQAAVGGDQTYGSGFEVYSAAAPAVTGHAFTQFSVGATGHAATIPGAFLPGVVNTLVAFAGWENGDAVVTQTPSGWVKLSTDNLGPVIFARTADGTEAGTVNLVTTTSVTGVAIVVRLTGAHPDVLEALSLPPRASATSTQPNPPSATQPGDWFLAPVRVLAAADWINDDVALTGNPAGYTVGTSGVSGGGANNGAGIAYAHRAVTTASEDPGPFTIASSQAWAAATVLARPEPDLGGTPGSFATGRFLNPVGSVLADLNVTTLDDLEFTLFTQAPEVTGLDVVVLAREGHGATCQHDDQPPSPTVLAESFNKADGPLGPDLTWSREVFDHEFELQVVNQRARYVVDSSGSFVDVQVPTPNFTSPDVTVALDVVSMQVTGTPGFVVDARVLSRFQLLDEGDDYRGYEAVISRTDFPFDLFNLRINRVDHLDQTEVLASTVFLGPGTLELPARLSLTSVGGQHRARLTHAGTGATLELQVADDTYIGGVSALSTGLLSQNDGIVRSIDVDNFQIDELVVQECTTCRAPLITYPRVCWSPSQLPFEDFEFFELQRREMGHDEPETIAILEKADPSVTAAGATLDTTTVIAEHPAPSLAAVGDELLFCHWHAWQPGDYSVTGTGMQPLGTSLRLPGSGRAFTTDKDVFNTSRLDVRFKLRLDDWTTPGFFGLFFIGQWPNTPTNNSWIFNISNTGVLSFTFTPDGTTGSAVTRTAGVGTGFVDGTVHHVRMTFVGNNGSGQNVTRFFTSEDGVAWTQLGATSTVAGVVTLPNSSAVLGIGEVLALLGDVYHVEVRNDVDGQVTADPDFHSLLPGATSLVDGAGNTWSWPGGTVVDQNELQGPDTPSIAAWQQVPAGATGTRIADIAPARNYATMSVLVRGVEGAPVLEEVVTELENDGVTLTTSGRVRRGDWLLALVGTPAGSDDDGIGPPTPGNWQLITDSGDTALDRPRVAAWVRPVGDDGPQVVRVPQTDDPAAPWDYHLRVVVLSNVAEFISNCYDDWSVAYGGEVCYRVRQGRSDGSVSDWSPEVCQTVRPPEGVDLVITAPDRPELNAAYNEAHGGLPTEREYTFLDAGDTTYQAVYGRDFQLAFRPTEERGVSFRRSLLVSPLCGAEQPCLDVVKPLRDLMTEPVSVLVVRDTCGNRWYASVLVESAAQLATVGLPDLWTAQVAVTELAVPLLELPTGAAAHPEMA